MADIRDATGVETSMNVDLSGATRLFKVNVGTGQCRLCNEVPVCVVYKASVPIAERARNNASQKKLELVKCMQCHQFLVLPNSHKKNMK